MSLNETAHPHTMEALRAKKGYIIDMDGVIYHGNMLLPGVERFVDFLKKNDKRFLFLTNSSERAPRELQQKLNQNGYHLDEDGVFGSNTYRAVVDYQKKNKLLVDGVVGDETWGSLNKVQQAAVPTKPTTGKDVMKGVSDETYNKLHKLEQGYVPSDEVETAQEIRRSMEALQPEKYKSSFEDELSQLYEQIAQRKPFAYDPQTDAQYKNYAYQYARRGRDAMEDTMGTAAGLTGGYASSYAQTASQQAYDRYMQELAELMPELESSARQRDQDQRNWLTQRYEQVSEQEQADYKRYRQEQEAWQESYDRAGKEADALREQEYADYKLMLQHYTSKANAEQKASGDGRANSGAAAKTEKKTTLSSTAMESLRRAMGNYLKGGKKQEAAALAQRYGSRMTAMQKKQLKKLFGTYGANLII